MSVVMIRTISSVFAVWFSGKSFVVNDAHSWVYISGEETRLMIVPWLVNR